jgi:cell division septation protein DedD
MNNERGGMLLKIIFIPAGVVLLAGVFFSGYYAGKHQNRALASKELAPPLPEMASGAGQKQEEFTFYKTLTDNNERMVSIDLKPKQVKEERKSSEQPAMPETGQASPVQVAPKDDRLEIQIEKEPYVPVKPKQAAAKQPRSLAKKESAAASVDVKHRYTVQTASYQEKGMAEEEVKRLKKRGYAAFIASLHLPGKGMWHRVRLGSFSNKAAAEQLQKTLQAKEGISPIVVLE